jgi:hypothetical protein
MDEDERRDLNVLFINLLILKFIKPFHHFTSTLSIYARVG